MTNDEIERKLEVFCSTPIEGEFKFIIEYLLSKIKELEERTAIAEKEGGWAINPEYFIEKRKLDNAEAHIKELEAKFQGEEQAHTMSVYDLNIRIAELIETLNADTLIMALRLLGEDENSFSPETREVMNRWRPKCLKLIKEKQ